MEFIETRFFSRAADRLLTEEEQRDLQRTLLRDPNVGKLLVNGGGLRKLRLGAGGKGKSGGARAIYYHHGGREIILLLVVYSKSRQDDLGEEELAQLRGALHAFVSKEFS